MMSLAVSNNDIARWDSVGFLLELFAVFRLDYVAFKLGVISEASIAAQILIMVQLALVLVLTIKIMTRKSPKSWVFFILKISLVLTVKFYN